MSMQRRLVTVLGCVVATGCGLTGDFDPPDRQAAMDAGTGGPDGGPRCMPEPDACNSIDDDCDAEIDEDFDLDGDPSHCGGCDVVCTFPDSIAGCESGGCAIETCVAGF